MINRYICGKCIGYRAALQITSDEFGVERSVRSFGAFYGLIISAYSEREYFKKEEIGFDEMIQNECVKCEYGPSIYYPGLLENILKRMDYYKKGKIADPNKLHTIDVDVTDSIKD